MGIKEYIPPFIKSYIRLIKVRRKYTQSEIHSSLIGEDVKLGIRTKIGLYVNLKKM